ncbi:MAG: hypothetical protein V4658_07275 [Bacteroidota bacterium]
MPVIPAPVEPVADKPVPVAPPPLFKSGLNSLDKLKQQIADKKKEQAEKQPEQQLASEPVVMVEDTPVTKEVFNTIWDLYLSGLHKDNKMSLAVVFKNAQWNLLNETTVELVLASQHEKELFDEERNNIIPFMRKNLKHTGFDFNIKVNSTIAKHRVFTAEEKFNAMAEKNPLLNELRNLLALDLEY